MLVIPNSISLQHLNQEWLKRLLRLNAVANTTEPETVQYFTECNSLQQAKVKLLPTFPSCSNTDLYSTSTVFVLGIGLAYSAEVHIFLFVYKTCSVSILLV